MTEGKLIIEVYEYTADSPVTPAFEFIPCPLADCFSRGNKATLKEIIQKGFDTLARKDQNTEKRKEVLQKLEEANIGRISVLYNKATPTSEAYIELTNVVQDTLADADVRRARKHKDDIILYGRYRLTDGVETTKLRDAQRLTLIYSTYAEVSDMDMSDDPEMIEEREAPKEICLNITYLQA